MQDGKIRASRLREEEKGERETRRERKSCGRKAFPGG